MKNNNLLNERVTVESGGFPNGNDGFYWSWKATDKNGLIYSDESFSYDQNPTSNVAQFVPLIKALEWIVKVMPSRPVTIFSCLEFIVNAVNDKVKVSKPHLIPLYKNAKQLLAKTNAVVEWQPKDKMTLKH